MSDAHTPPPHWDPARYAEHARFVSDLGLPVVDLLSPRANERILDLGCGDGALTARLVERGARVVGVDASANMVAAAVARGLDARVMDGTVLAFVDEFDAVFSNAALHWMNDADRVIDGVWRALRPGGRFVAEMGGHGNTATLLDAVESALARHGATMQARWYFPTAESYRARLEARGFIVQDLSLFARPTPLPGELAAWLETFLSASLDALPLATRRVVVSEIEAALRPRLFEPEGRWVIDYVRLRFKAVKPA